MSHQRNKALDRRLLRRRLILHRVGCVAIQRRERKCSETYAAREPNRAWSRHQQQSFGFVSVKWARKAGSITPVPNVQRVLVRSQKYDRDSSQPTPLGANISVPPPRQEWETNFCREPIRSSSRMPCLVPMSSIAYGASILPIASETMMSPRFLNEHRICAAA